MKDTLHYIISSIVDSPDSVVIDENEVDGIINFVVTVAKEDMGKIIGKEGKVIRSIRNIMKIKAMKTDVRINITLADIPQDS
ncbi:MAG TPA: KH domain-containing protein [Candidatus Limnocylindrales bacterium]|nr:KH domain-containing protein [Candidatus Limnocylindrales bacterium]